jgi:hypothetical protein
VPMHNIKRAVHNITAPCTTAKQPGITQPLHRICESPHSDFNNLDRDTKLTISCNHTSISLRYWGCEEHGTYHIINNYVNKPSHNISSSQTPVTSISSHPIEFQLLTHSTLTSHYPPVPLNLRVPPSQPLPLPTTCHTHPNKHTTYPHLKIHPTTPTNSIPQTVTNPPPVPP